MPVVRSHLLKDCKDRRALASYIKHTSFEMFPCLGCEKRNTKYIISDKENSGRYSEYVLCKVSCNVKGILVGEWRLLEREEECLERESEAAMCAVCKNMVCLKHLKKQKRFLRSKSKDMLCHKLKILDKLEEAEEKKRQEEERKRVAEAAATLPTTNPSNLSDPFAKLEVLLLPPKVWAD
jgi:hypothetical protein